MAARSCLCETTTRSMDGRKSTYGVELAAACVARRPIWSQRGRTYAVRDAIIRNASREANTAKRCFACAMTGACGCVRRQVVKVEYKANSIRNVFHSFTIKKLLDAAESAKTNIWNIPSNAQCICFQVKQKMSCHVRKSNVIPLTGSNIATTCVPWTMIPAIVCGKKENDFHLRAFHCIENR